MFPIFGMCKQQPYRAHVYARWSALASCPTANSNGTSSAWPLLAAALLASVELTLNLGYEGMSMPSGVRAMLGELIDAVAVCGVGTAPCCCRPAEPRILSADPIQWE